MADRPPEAPRPRPRTLRELEAQTRVPIEQQTPLQAQPPDLDEGLQWDEGHRQTRLAGGA